MPNLEYQLLPLYDRADGPVVAYAKVDPEDYERLNSSRWKYAAHNGYAWRAEKLYLHRTIMGLTAGDGLVVDHRNGDRLDCRKSELRVCPRGQKDNMQNVSKADRRSKSGYRGVIPDGRGMWRARVFVEGTEHKLGVFADVEEAAEVVERFRLENLPFYGGR